MPKEAIARGAVNLVVPLERIASTALNVQNGWVGRKDELQKR
jgi:hypothetical protein